MKSLGATIRLLRESHGLSAVELANSIEVDKSYISLIESGTRKPSVELLNKLAERLRVPLDFLVDISIERKREKGCELVSIFGEFEALERKLKDVLRKQSRRTKAS